MLSHLVSTGRFFTRTQSSLIHLSKTAFLLLRSPISASWALLVPPPHTYLTSFEVQAGDPAQTLVLELAESMINEKLINQLSHSSISTWLLLLFPQPPEEYASHLPAVTLGPAPLGPHSAPIKVRISQMLRGKGTVFVRGEILCDSKQHCGLLYSLERKQPLLTVVWKAEANSSIFLHPGNALGSRIHGSTCWSSLWKWCQLFGKCVCTWVCFV